MEKLLLTVTEAGELLGMGRSQTYVAVKRSELPIVRIAGRMYVPRQALEEVLRERGLASLKREVSHA